VGEGMRKQHQTIIGIRLKNMVKCTGDQLLQDSIVLSNILETARSLA